MKTAIFPGSFDPVTRGHLDLINRSMILCDRLIVAVLTNPDKQGFFPVERRIAMINGALAPREGLEVISFSGLLVDVAERVGADFVIRGVRGVQDLENETAMAFTNAQLRPGLETIFLPASPQFATLSSSLVRQIASFQGDISFFVPASAVDEIRGRFYNMDKHT